MCSPRWQMLWLTVEGCPTFHKWRHSHSRCKCWLLGSIKSWHPKSSNIWPSKCTSSKTSNSFSKTKRAKIINNNSRFKKDTFRLVNLMELNQCSSRYAISNCNSSNSSRLVRYGASSAKHITKWCKDNFRVAKAHSVAHTSKIYRALSLTKEVHSTILMIKAKRQTLVWLGLPQLALNLLDLSTKHVSSVILSFLTTFSRLVSFQRCAITWSHSGLISPLSRTKVVPQDPL